jgi:hypothetical protein
MPYDQRLHRRDDSKIRKDANTLGIRPRIYEAKTFGEIARAYSHLGRGFQDQLRKMLGPHENRSEIRIHCFKVCLKSISEDKVTVLHLVSYSQGRRKVDCQVEDIKSLFQQQVIT